MDQLAPGRFREAEGQRSGCSAVPKSLAMIQLAARTRCLRPGRANIDALVVVDERLVAFVGRSGERDVLARVVSVKEAYLLVVDAAPLTGHRDPDVQATNFEQRGELPQARTRLVPAEVALNDLAD